MGAMMPAILERASRENPTPVFGSEEFLGEVTLTRWPACRGFRGRLTEPLPRCCAPLMGAMGGQSPCLRHLRSLRHVWLAAAVHIAGSSQALTLSRRISYIPLALPTRACGSHGRPLAGLPSLSGAPIQGHGSFATVRPDTRNEKAVRLAASVSPARPLAG